MIDLAIIPARGGSVGLPGKNVRLLGGRPLIAWTVAAALESRLFARVVVSTDDAVIAQAARDAGAEVPFVRPAELASNTAGSLEVVDHALETLGADGDFALLQPTSPFRSAAHVRAAAALFAESRAPAAISVGVGKPMAWYYQRNAIDGSLTPLADGPGAVQRRQDAAPLVHPNGAIYIIGTAPFRQHRGFTPPGTVALPMDAISSIDIDDAGDFALAEAVVAARLHEAPR